MADPWRNICALPAFWVGLLYDGGALDEAEELTREWGFAETDALRDAVPVKGLDATIGNRSLHEVARDVLAIARRGLIARGRLNSEGHDEAHFLAPLEEITARGKTSAENMLELYDGRWNRSVEPVFEEYAY